MTNENQIFLLERQARSLFNRLIHTSRRMSFLPSWLPGCNSMILDLKTLIEIVPVESEYSGTMQDIDVCLIIGTENRSQDFNSCFYPCHEWMAQRWIKIYRLMHSEGISEPVKLIEYGGHYFVRDGNHRISVAIHSGIEYVTAEIIHYRIPVKLPSFLSRNNLELLSEKYLFHKRTGIFDIINDDLFVVRSPKTWKRLEKEIYVYSRSWFVRHNGREPENNEEFITYWLDFYKITIEHIHKRSMLLLFPGMGEADVFVSFIDYWNSYEDPDSFWVGEIYDKFERYVQKRRILLLIYQFIVKHIRKISTTAEDEKKFFINTTLITSSIKGFNIPLAGRQFFTLCYKQIFYIHAKLWMNKKQRQPELEDINIHWYDTFYKPVMERYKNKLYPVTFEHFYITFSRRYYFKIISAKSDVEACLDEFEKKNYH